MRFYGHSLRWLLPVLLIFSASTQMLAQNTKQPPSGDAAKLIEQANSGDAKSQFVLGLMYDYGVGVAGAKDEVQAARWFRKSAEQGYMQAQYNLGLLYDKGEGVPKDVAEAYFWMSGASVSDEKVRATRDRIGETLTPEKRLEIQERSRKWEETHPLSGS
jgi:hypothetical protein